jgi:hypothetical protein
MSAADYILPNDGSTGQQVGSALGTIGSVGLAVATKGKYKPDPVAVGQISGTIFGFIGSTREHKHGGCGRPRPTAEKYFVVCCVLLILGMLVAPTTTYTLIDQIIQCATGIINMIFEN